MSTQAEERGHVRGVSARFHGVDETKAAFKTTEFMADVASVAAVLIASAINDAIDGRLAWILVAALGIGYMLSRGLEVGQPPPRRRRHHLARVRQRRSLVDTMPPASRCSRP